MAFIFVGICNHKHIIRQSLLMNNRFADEQYCYGNFICYSLSWKVIHADYYVSQLSGSYAMTSAHLLNVVLLIQSIDNRWDYIPFVSKRFYTRSQEYSYKDLCFNAYI